MRALANGTELFYLIEGTGGVGPPLFLTHGPGFDHTFFRPWLDPLSQRRQVIFWDSRGCGLSSRSTELAGTTLDTLAEDVDALRSHLGLGRIVLHGHSFGGFIVLAYALKHPQNLAGLILDCAVPAFDYQPLMTSNLVARGTVEQVQQVTKAFEGQIASDNGLREVWELVLPLYFHRDHAKPETQLFEQMKFSVAVMNHFLTLIPTLNMIDQLHKVLTPTLVLGGRDDWICPPTAGAERLHAGLKNSQLKVFEYSGHFPFIEEQENYLQTVAKWLDSLQ